MPTHQFFLRFAERIVYLWPYFPHIFLWVCWLTQIANSRTDMIVLILPKKNCLRKHVTDLISLSLSQLFPNYCPKSPRNVVKSPKSCSAMLRSCNTIKHGGRRIQDKAPVDSRSLESVHWCRKAQAKDTQDFLEPISAPVSMCRAAYGHCVQSYNLYQLQFHPNYSLPPQAKNTDWSIDCCGAISRTDRFTTEKLLLVCIRGRNT